MTALRVAGLTVLCALLTWAVGWWPVLGVSLLAGAVWRRDDAARLVTVAATLAWCLWLLVDALDGELAAVSRTVGRVFGAPAVVMLAVTILFIATGAWSAATLGAELGRAAVRSPRRPEMP